MTRKRKKILIITVPILVVIIVGVILLMLYIKTDFLKSDKTLFLKYVSQNVDAVKIAINNTDEKEYTNLLRQAKYEQSSELSAKYVENLETSQENTKNDINKLKLKTDTKSDYLNNYSYKNINLTYNDESLLTAEYIHDNQIYGIRFPEEFNQFLAIKNTNIKQVAENIGMTADEVELVPDSIDEIDVNNILTFTDDEISTLQSKYLGIISENITNEKYSRQKNVLITIGDKSLYTNAYSITLTQEQANDIYIKILEQLKEDEIILSKISQLEPYVKIYDFVKEGNGVPHNNYLQDYYAVKVQDKIDEIQRSNIGTNEVKYTVYESKGNTVRTQIVEDAMEITLDIMIENNNVDIELKRDIANQEQENSKSLSISKKSNGNEKSFNVKQENILGGTFEKIEIYRNINMDSSEPKTETGIIYKDGKENLLEAKYTEDTKLNQQFSKTVEANEVNTVIMNNYDAEKITSWINLVKDFLVKKMQNNQTIIANTTKVNLIRKIF